VLFYENHTLTTVLLGEAKRVDHLLWLKYYATVRDTGAVRTEAHLLASALCATADSLSLPYIRIQPVIAIGTRATRITWNWDHWFAPSRLGTACTAAPIADPRSAPN
jgi:hypothetical protein